MVLFGFNDRRTLRPRYFIRMPQQNKPLSKRLQANHKSTIYQVKKIRNPHHLWIINTQFQKVLIAADDYIYTRYNSGVENGRVFGVGD